MAESSSPKRLRTSSLDQENLRTLCVSVSSMLQSIAETNDGYNLDSFEVKAEIGAEGEIRLIGGVKGKISGGITLKFKKTDK